MSIAKKILSIILAISLVMGIAALSVCAVQTEPSAGLQATTSQWWESLPDWIQGILRWLFFGWLWMKPITSQIQPLNPETVANNLMRAIETKDIDLFIEQLSLGLQQNAEDLQGKIGAIFDVLDGEILDVKWEKNGDHQVNQGNGKIIKETILHIDYTTATGKYRLGGGLMYYNSFQPENMGVDLILLTEYDPPYTLFVEIRTTS